MKTKRLRLFLVGVWEPILIALASVLILGGLMLYRLGNLVPQLSMPEVIAHKVSSNINLIINNPLNLPYKALSFGVNYILHPSAWSLRAVSVFFAIISVLLFYYVVSRWYNRLNAILGTLLFACSAWFLHYARLATPDITLTLLIASLAYGLWIRKTKRSVLVGIIGIILAATLIYTPGLIGLVVIGGIWQSKHIAEHFKETKIAIPLIIFMAAMLLAPLVIGLAHNPILARSLVGLPIDHWPTALDYIKDTFNVPVQIFLRGPYNPVVWLGRLPLLDIFTTAMVILGAYTYYQHRKLDTAKLVFGVLIIGSLLIGLGGSVSMIILTPFIYLLAVAGIDYLLTQWQSVFPRNPLARTIGASLITLAVFLSCFYNLRQYFIAWPGAPATKITFRHKV